MSDEAKKDDAEKLPYDLMPWDAVDQVVAVLRHGATKYGRNNWRTGSGFQWSRLIAAAFRHLTAFAKGEDNDPETGLSHLAHASCCVLFLLHYKLNRNFDIGDDRHGKN